MAQSPKPKLASKTCIKCGTYLTGNSYYPTKSPYFPDGTLTICRMCLAEMVGDSWELMDKLCQWADYPFLPDVWSKMSRELGERALDSYIKGFTTTSTYETNNWKQAHDEWAGALADGSFRERIPEINDTQLAELRAAWGSNYKVEELLYMDKFYKDLCNSHSIITPTQMDAARTLARLSIRISQKISAGAEIDKDIASYDREMKIGGFTMENVKNMDDFESIGELIFYLEKHGWKNPYYDGAPKDVVDTTIMNMQSFLRRIVMNETTLKDTVEQRLASIGLNETGTLDLSDADFDRYENEGFNDIEVAAQLIDDTDEQGEMDVDET